MLYAFQQLEATEPPDGCTGVVVMPSASRSGKLIHAQNWDWRVESLELGVVLRIQPDEGPSMLTFAEAEPRFRVRRNEPYGPADGVTHTLKEHGIANGLLNVMIEVRNDLIAGEAGREIMAGFLAGLIRESLATAPARERI
eukprot:gene36054-48512_t